MKRKGNWFNRRRKIKDKVDTRTGRQQAEDRVLKTLKTTKPPFVDKKGNGHFISQPGVRINERERATEQFDNLFAPENAKKKPQPNGTVDESQWLLFGIKHQTQGYRYEYGPTRKAAIDRLGWRPQDVVYCLDMSGLEDKKLTPENAGTRHSLTMATVPMSIEEREMKMSKETLTTLRARREENATKKPVLTGLAAFNAKRAAEKAAEKKVEPTIVDKIVPEKGKGKKRITKEQEQHLFGKDKKAAAPKPMPEKYMALSPNHFGFASTIVEAKKNLKKNGGDIGKCGIYLVPGDYFIDAMGNAHGSSVGQFLSGKDYRKGLKVTAPKGAGEKEAAKNQRKAQEELAKVVAPKKSKGDSIATPKAPEKVKVDKVVQINEQKKKAAKGTNGEFRKNTIVIFGQHTVTGVLRWMGKEDFSFNEAQSAFKKMKLKREPTDLCILTYLYRGKKGVGEPAKLTGDQQKILRASLETNAGKKSR